MVGFGWCVDARAVWAAPPNEAASQSSTQGCDVACRDLVRAQIGKDFELRRRWRRGSLLVGLGVPVAAGGVALTIAGALLWNTVAVDRFDHDPPLPPPAAPIAMTFVGVAAVGGAVTMIVLGALDRSAARREARHRLSLSLVPARRGALLGAAMRF
jgi:hypothetical protein